MMTHEVMASDSRESGMKVITNPGWGMRLCQFYRNREELLDILIPYFTSGLKNGEMCIWVASEPLDEAAAREAVKSMIAEGESYLGNGQFRIISHGQFYLKGGSFEPEKMPARWAGILKEMLKKGYEGIRVAENASWSSRTDWQRHREYVRLMNEAAAHLRLSVVDTYWMDRCGPYELIDAATIHHQALVREGDQWRSVDNPEIRNLREIAQQSNSRMKAAQEKLSHEIEEKTKLEEGLTEKSEELTTFTFKIGHELKNNIVAMQKVFEIIDRDPDNVRKYAELIRKNHEKLIRFADELFKLTHAEKIISCEEEIDAESLIRKIFNQARPMDVMTKISFRESFPAIKGDPLAMDVVFSNLINNALQFRDENKKMFTLKVGYRLVGDSIEISFKDNGKGISKGSLNKIFDLNFTTDRNKNFGFGLAIVKKIMTAHGGSVEARSSGTRNGAEFIISLPHAADRGQSPELDGQEPAADSREEAEGCV